MASDSGVYSYVWPIRYTRMESFVTPLPLTHKILVVVIRSVRSQPSARTEYFMASLEWTLKLHIQMYLFVFFVGTAFLCIYVHNRATRIQPVPRSGLLSNELSL